MLGKRAPNPSRGASITVTNLPSPAYRRRSHGSACPSRSMRTMAARTSATTLLAAMTRPSTTRPSVRCSSLPTVAFPTTPSTESTMRSGSTPALTRSLATRSKGGGSDHERDHRVPSGACHLSHLRSRLVSMATTPRALRLLREAAMSDCVDCQKGYVHLCPKPTEAPPCERGLLGGLRSGATQNRLPTNEKEDSSHDAD